MSQFSQHYAQLHDEDLIELALTRELVPEASEALHAELARRGFSDLSAHRTIWQREALTQETHRQAQVSHRAKVVGWRTKSLYVTSLFFSALRCLSHRGAK